MCSTAFFVDYISEISNNIKGGDDLEDCEIVELFFNGSELAVKELANKYGNLLYRIAKNILVSSEDAEECVNDTFLNVFNSIPPHNPNNLLAYAGKIARYVSINRLKYNKRQKRNGEIDLLLCELDECIPSKKDVTDDFNEQHTLEAINRFLRMQDDEMQVLFVRRYVQMESIEDLAKCFHISQSNVSTKLYRARKKLKKFLENEGVSI